MRLYCNGCLAVYEVKRTRPGNGGKMPTHCPFCGRKIVDMGVEES